MDGEAVLEKYKSQEKGYPYSCVKVNSKNTKDCDIKENNIESTHDLLKEYQKIHIHSINIFFYLQRQF